MILHRKLKHIKAKNILKEARFLIKKKGKKLGDDARNEIEQAIKDLEGKANAGNADDVHKSKEILQELISKHLPRTTLDVVADFFKALITAVIIALLFRQFVIEPFEIPTGSMIPTLKIGDKILVSKFTYGLNIPFINAKTFSFNKPDRWEVVVFTTRNIKDSSGIERNFVKRIVGLPGETISIQNGEIFLFETGQDGTEVMSHIPKPDYLQALEPNYCNYQNVEEGKTSSIELYDKKKWRGIIPVSVPNGNARIIPWKYGFAGQKIHVPPGHYFVLGDNSRDSFDSRGWGFVPFENIRGRVICKWRFLPPWAEGFVR